MTAENTFEIFVVATPGLEPQLLDEMHRKGFAGATAIPGGIAFQGGWEDVWRANLHLRGASRVLARFGSFLAFHLAQLDKRARKFPWAQVLRPDVPVKVEVTCKASKIYHAGAAAQRIETALREELGCPIAADAEIVLKVRIDDNTVTLSVDTSGESLHKRGHKAAVGKAPMRETLAALFLDAAGYTGDEPVVDPMCGSGTFIIEAAEIAAGLAPGRSRGFAFEKLASFDAMRWQQMRDAVKTRALTPRFFGSDRDAGAIRMSAENAARAGVGHATVFACHGAGEVRPPDGPPGLVIVNPPYGARIGNKKLLFPLYATFGQTMQAHFRGWRVALVTSEPGLAKATGLPFLPQGPAVAHGGTKVWLFRTAPLG